MRKRLLLALSGALVLVAGGLAAAWCLVVDAPRPVYSRVGIHPQCAVRQADPPRPKAKPKPKPRPDPRLRAARDELERARKRERAAERELEQARRAVEEAQRALDELKP